MDYEGQPILHTYKRKAKKGKKQPQVGLGDDGLRAETKEMTKKNDEMA